jgi:hypothetical protein
MALQAKEIRHGMAVTLPDGSLWEILDRSPGANTWWLHCRDAAGNWQTTWAHIRDMQAAGLGSRQETLISEELLAA